MGADPLAWHAQPTPVAVGLRRRVLPDITTPCADLFLKPGRSRDGGGRGEPGGSRQGEQVRAPEPGPAPRQPRRSPWRGPRRMLTDARGCSRMLTGTRRRGHSGPRAHLPSLPGVRSSARAFAVYCLIIDIILQMAFGPANGITGVILLLVNYNQFVWDAFPVFVCNCSPHSLMTVTQQKLCSFAQG